MDIISYLLELLQLRKEVGIIDLGTFYKKKNPGRYDKEKQSFLPPSYSLQFTSDLKEDEAFVNFISEKENISAERSREHITQFTEDIKQKLAVDHEAELANLGRLFFTEHEGLSFEPVENVSYGSEFYGLPSLQDSVTIDKPISEENEEGVYEEISEAPVAPPTSKDVDPEPPVIENIELDEVKDDLKNTLKHSIPAAEEEVTDAPEFIKEQHEEHPDRFGHTPESEIPTQEEVQDISDDHEAPEPIIEAPEFIKEQHEEHPDRFGHTTESETLANEINQEITPKQEEEPKTYLNLEGDKVPAEPVIEAPEFIKEQHAEHPNRFGHDPMIDEPVEEESKSIWPKIIAVILILAIIAALVYFLKPDLFNQQPKIETTPPTVAELPKVEVDTAKAKQDSIAKTDSILKANQVGKMIDPAKSTPSVTKATKIESPTDANITFEVIAASYETENGAQRYIKSVRKLGINARIVRMPGPRKNISIGSFKTQEEAIKERDILQTKLKDKGFYVQQIKNNTQP